VGNGLAYEDFSFPIFLLEDENETKVIKQVLILPAPSNFDEKEDYLLFTPVWREACSTCAHFEKQFLRKRTNKFIFLTFPSTSSFFPA
jgi:hypothetical protein